MSGIFLFVSATMSIIDSDQEWGGIEMSTGVWEALTVGVKIPRTRVLTKLSRDLLSRVSTF